MEHETDPRQHERLCAWLLDEMDADERAAFAAELAADPLLQTEADRMERTVALVRRSGAEAPALSAARRASLNEALPGGRALPRRFAVAAAALLVVAGGAATALAILADDPGRPATGARIESVAGTADSTSEDPLLDSGAERPVGREPRVVEATRPAAPTEAAGAAGPSGELWREPKASGGGAPARQADPVAESRVAVVQNNPPAESETVVTSERRYWGAIAGVGGGAGGGLRAEDGAAGSNESAFDSNAWNSAIGLGGGVGAAQGAGRERGTGTLMFFRGPGDSAPPATALAPSGFDVFFVGSATGASIELPRVDPDALFRFCRPRPNERPRDMYFRFWGDNAFVLTRSDALATFAADVDTASYVLARRYLREGNLPQKAQIRTEEFVNYFDPDLASPAEGDFAIHTELAPSPFGGSNSRWMLRVGLRAREIPVDRREPLALTFVVDTSGSMQRDRRLELVKHALMMLVNQLDEQDRIGIVTFSNDARLVLPMTPADRAAEIATIVQGLQPAGSTNAEAGLQLGYELAATALDPERHSRVVFLSDGVANVGQTDQDRIAADVRARRDAGILLNTIGVGMGNHNDVFLEQLANQGDGICDYVDDAHSVHRAIVERFTGAFQAVAADVKIQVEFDDGPVLRWRQLGYENRAVADQDFRNDAVDAGEVGSGHQVTALFELESVITPEAIESVGDGTWATVRVRWLPPRRAGDEGAREATEVEHRVDAASLVRSFDAASPGFRRAAVVAQFAEVLRRSSHAAGDSWAELKTRIGAVTRLPEFTSDADTAELAALVERAEALGITREIEVGDLDRAIAEYKRHRYLRHQLAQIDDQPEPEELEELRRQNDRLEERIRRLMRGR